MEYRVKVDRKIIIIGSVQPSESGTIAAFQGEKKESQLDEKGNALILLTSFNMHDRYLFPFSSLSLS